MVHLDYFSDRSTNWKINEDFVVISLHLIHDRTRSDKLFWYVHPQTETTPSTTAAKHSHLHLLHFHWVTQVHLVMVTCRRSPASDDSMGRLAVVEQLKLPPVLRPGLNFRWNWVLEDVRCSVQPPELPLRVSTLPSDECSGSGENWGASLSVGRVRSGNWSPQRRSDGIRPENDRRRRILVGCSIGSGGAECASDGQSTPEYLPFLAWLHSLLPVNEIDGKGTD